MKKNIIIIIISIFCVVLVLINIFDIKIKKDESINKNIKQNRTQSIFDSNTLLGSILNSFDCLYPNEVTFINKNYYGDLEHYFSFKGTIQNISKESFRNIFVLFVILDSSKTNILPDKVWYINSYIPAIFYDNFDYLASNDKVSFDISINLYSDLGADNAKAIIEAIECGCFYYGIYKSK